MATDYVKVRPYVARRMGVLDARSRYADGSVRLWLPDLRSVDRGYVYRVDRTVARIGGVRLNPYEARDEQDATREQCVAMPLPSDPDWMPWPDEIAEGLALDLAPAGSESGNESSAESASGEEPQAGEEVDETQEGGES